MVSRFIDIERKTILAQFITVEPLIFYSTSDGTDLVQDLLRSQFNRSDADLSKQEGLLSIDDQGEYFIFEPTDTKNHTLHLSIEHLAYCGALRRMRNDLSDSHDPNRIQRREFENVDLANRYAHLIIGPSIFVAVFHGFDNALCYTFVTQNSDDACLLVMKLMRAFKLHEQKLEQQGQINQGFPSFPPLHGSSGPPSPVGIKQTSPLNQPSQAFFTDNRQTLPSPIHHQISKIYSQDPRQDELIQRLLTNPNLQLVSQPTPPFVSQRIDDIPIISAPSTINQRTSPIIENNNMNSLSTGPLIGRSTPPPMRAPSPPILGISNTSNMQNLSLTNTNPQVIYKPNNQEVVYKQNIMVRWLQPPTPPPPAPIIIREIQAPSEIQPPIVCRQIPPCPPTPPPIIVREKPPPCPPAGKPLIIEKRLPPVTLPRQVIVERYPPPPPKPATIIYEKYLPPVQQQRQVIVKREICQPTTLCSVTQQQQQQQHIPGRHLVREIVRQIPQTSTIQPGLVCVPQQQTTATTQPQTIQQLVPVFATRQHIVQPRGVRLIRQVIAPSQVALQQPQQLYSSNVPSIVQTVPTTLMQ